LEVEYLRAIITEGKLKTYYFGTSFIEVFWSHSSLQEDHYCRFRFTTAQEKYLDATIINTRSLYIKRNSKVMSLHAEELVKSLV